MTQGRDRASGTTLPLIPRAGPLDGRGKPFVLRVGLTGGIAAGKTTVARIFASLGATILDADEIAHRLVEKEAPAYQPVIQAFGEEILNPDRSISRPRLARLIFSDPQRRSALEAILHPLIRKEEANLVELLADTGQGRIAVSNAALLIETGIYRDYHRVIVVHCAPATQLDRIVRRDGLSEEEARARIGAQMDSREKLKVAHYAIDTTPGMSATEARARAVFRHLQQDLQALSDVS
jgi:dephospho-CoA kinase